MSNAEKESPLIEVFFIILGETIQGKYNPNMKLHGAVQKVLADTGNTGQPFSKWLIKTEDGTALSMDNSFKEENIASGSKLYLSLQAGKGGTINNSTRSDRS